MEGEGENVRPIRYRGRQPRRINEDDIASWFKATEKPPKEYTIERLREHMRMKNPVRWRRLRKDFAWMMREMKKLGMNPEDARWLP